jgi:hypothetical protein
MENGWGSSQLEFICDITSQVPENDVTGMSSNGRTPRETRNPGSSPGFPPENYAEVMFCTVAP